MFPIADECKDIFTAIKLRRQYAYAIMKIENRKEIVLKKYTDPLPDNTQETNEVVFNKMKEDLVSLGELVSSSLTLGLHEEMVLPRMLRDTSIGVLMISMFGRRQVMPGQMDS
ncbi:uncharacterized protein [Porites lutea]|uniref:uncharacterized protein n=1 Tax=Porites lutea TaxID=51062 RepID=UPI003CC6AD3E